MTATHPPTTGTTSRLGRLLGGVSILGVLMLAACGSDGGGGSTEAFCTEISALTESPDGGTDEENLAALQAVADAAPGEISGDVDTLVEVFGQLQAVDLEAATDDEIAEFENLVADLDEASVNIETYAEENCPDLPAGIFDN